MKAKELSKVNFGRKEKRKLNFYNLIFGFFFAFCFSLYKIKIQFGILWDMLFEKYKYSAPFFHY
jgi:hypothetical protein